ncbi:MAG TPA: indole-3-glycerol phosphate synthase TrpC [Aggregatilineales bacterium]|nr:indole-3-glycerol phosphate synthase TrpC [Aggregatilineales bacterium]
MSGIRATGTILDQIVARKLDEIAALPTAIPVDRAAPEPRDFAGALRRDRVALIAEIKHASPSKGVLIDPFDPVALGRTYSEAGAAAISILTDRDFFQGSLDDLRAVRAAVPTPILRKDFTIDARQIAEARTAGADAILLIVAILDDAKLRDLAQVAKDHGLAALVEVHTEAEMERALKLTPPLIGINNRDLHTFKVDLAATRRLAAMVPHDVTLVAESGIFTRADVEAVAGAGARAILVGESIVSSPDIGVQIRALSGVALPSYRTLSQGQTRTEASVRP